MDLRHLRHFIAVAEEGHFGRAAARLGIEQSPLSRSIRHLEGQLHCPLLRPSPKGSVLTAMGAALLPEARALLAHAARLKTHVIDVEATVTRVLRLGVSDAVATPHRVRVRPAPPVPGPVDRDCTGGRQCDGSPGTEC